MKIGASDIYDILPAALKSICALGVCDPGYLEEGKRVFCNIPDIYGGPRWSARPAEILPGTRSIISLLHFTPLGFDYSVDSIALSVAEIIWKKLSIRTHLLDGAGKADMNNIIGHERSRYGNYDAGKKIVLLKSIAYYAGLGQFGKNSLLINGRFGSDMKIQALFSEEALKPGKPLLPKGHPACEKCDICVRNCPAGIIGNYSLRAGKNDLCRGSSRVGRKPALIGRLAKERGLWNNAFFEQKLVCRICQSFCPLNKKHYLKDSLIFAKMSDRPGKYTFYYSMKSR